MKNKKGFTLVELLATIVILGIIMALVAYFSKDLLLNTKENSYKVTLNEISSNAKEYLLERSELHYIPVYIENADGDKEETDYEYQCITVENLIDAGYLKDSVTNSPISDNDNVRKDGYVYIERNIKTKTVEKALYIGNDTDDYNCGRAVKAQGVITFKAYPEGWQREKHIDIKYEYWNINDTRTEDNYMYDYQYYLDKNGEKFSNPVNGINGSGKLYGLNNGIVSGITVTENGYMNANITYKGENLVNGFAYVDDIDRVGPDVKMGNYNYNNNPVMYSVNIPLVLSDYGSGAQDGTFTTDDLVVTVGGIQVSQNENEKEKYQLFDNDNGNYILELKHHGNNGRVIITIASGKLFDNLNNPNLKIEIDTLIDFENKYLVTYDANGGTVNPSSFNATYGSTYGTLAIPTRTGYTFDGWFTEKNGGLMVNATDIVTITDPITIFAHWTIKKFTLTVNRGTCPVATGGGVYEYNSAATINVSVAPKYIFNSWTKNSGSNITNANLASTTIVITENTKVTANCTEKKFIIDLNGYLDGSTQYNINGYGTADVIINGQKVADDVSDYYAEWPYGTTYTINDIKAASGKTYESVHSGSTHGVLVDNNSVFLKFKTNSSSSGGSSGGGGGGGGGCTCENMCLDPCTCTGKCQHCGGCNSPSPGGTWYNETQ